MPSSIVAFTLGTVPPNFCPSGATPAALWQSVFQMLIGIMNGTVSGDGTFLRSASNPAAADQGKLWLKLDAAGNPIGLYYYANGFWVWPNFRQAPSETLIWKYAENPNLWQFDGGDGTDPSVNSPSFAGGAMWQTDTDFAFAMPIGVGQNPVIYNGQTVGTLLQVGQTGGEERHVLSMDEMWHQHSIGIAAAASGQNGWSQIALETRVGGSTPLTPNAPGWTCVHFGLDPVDGATYTDIASADLHGVGPLGVQTDTPIAADANHLNTVTNITPPAPTAHNTLPPYRVVIFAKRTARVMYRGDL